MLQGSILGPLLFHLNINDIYVSSDKLKFHLFANDTNILIANKNLKSLEQIVTQELCNLRIIIFGLQQEGGGVSRVNIGRLITTSVTSRHTSMFFQNGGQFSCSLFLQKMTIFRRSGKLFCRARMTKHLKNRKE